jgi:peptidoglycan/xylan/chitin deacetylase (PgdA/CDA1 family)
MRGLLRSGARTALHRGGGLALAQWYNRQRLRILMYHRFSDSAALARQCVYIRAHYQPVSMSETAEWLHGGRSLPLHAIAVTVDDGYQDFEQVAFPVFAEYGIRATVFLVTDFIDGKLWLWFDQVQYAFRHARVPHARMEMPNGGVLCFDLGSEASRRAAGQQTADMAATLSAADRRSLLANLPACLQVEIPESAPAECAPLSWEAIRRLAASGVEFGAHTKTHPILSSLKNMGDLRDEIAGSKARIEFMLDKPVQHFCYPNGKWQDIGPLAAETVRASGMRTAVTAEPGLNRAGQDAWLLRRIGAEPTHEERYFQQCLAGISGSSRMRHYPLD